MRAKIRNIVKLLERVKIPFLNNISLYKIILIYIKGLTKGALGIRAAAASWNIFMSLFPFLIFLFLFINYLPYYEEIQGLIYNYLLNKLLPPNIFEMVDIYMHERMSLVNKSLNNPNIFILIFSIFLFVFLSSKGVRGLIMGFRSINNKDHIEFKGIKFVFMSTGIVLFFSLFLVVSLVLIYISEVIFRFFESSFPFDTDIYRMIINITNFILTLFIFFLGICFLYYFGRTVKLSFRGVMPGALLTTFLFSLTTYFFGYYIANFTRFNVLYGSLGSVLIVMIWINLSVTFILSGYELNVALKKAKSEKHE